QRVSTSGNDDLSGSAGNDEFVWHANDAGTTAQPAVDTVSGFGLGGDDPNGDDVLDLSGLLIGEENADDLTTFLHLAQDGNDTVLSINTKGELGDNGSNSDQKIVLKDVALSDFAGQGDQADMIKNIIDQGKVNVDQ
ncbi:MAG: type I secretion C-terminal target domain-containing protein, partial [Porticoccaceae bacterium]|nr:type I secretion C-terminal target domain-containing protein [Porticoccaceae bacterium]